MCSVTQSGKVGNLPASNSQPLKVFKGEGASDLHFRRIPPMSWGWQVEGWVLTRQGDGEMAGPRLWWDAKHGSV